jgi:phospholipid-binding lipoprotein MlaA
MLMLAATVLLSLSFGLQAQEEEDGDTPRRNPQDPLEGFNRSMFAINERIDGAVMKPLAQGYDAAVPLPAKSSINNFYDNLRDINRSGNAFLQGKAAEGFTGLGRLIINSTVGIFGLFDVASEVGLAQGEEDFGQTLAVWGVPSGPYLFLPLVGPNTTRDFAGFGIDQYASPLWHQVNDHSALRNSMVGLNAVKIRANMLPLDRIVDEAALDKYAYIRAAFLQRRAAMVRDGNPPNDSDDDNDEDNNTRNETQDTPPNEN